MAVPLMLSLVGDCAELFDYCNQDMIEAKAKLLLQMSLVLIWGMRTSPSRKSTDLLTFNLGANKPVIRIARIAGQFAKCVSTNLSWLVTSLC